MPKKEIGRQPVPRLVYRKFELAEALGVSRWTLDRIIASGELGTTVVGTTAVVPVAEVERYLKRHFQCEARDHGRTGANHDARDARASDDFRAGES